MNRHALLGLGMACASVIAVLALAAGPAHAQTDLLYYAPNEAGGSNTQVLTTSAGGTLTPTTTIGSGGNSSGFAAAVRGDQAFAYVTFNGSNVMQVIDTATPSVVQTIATGVEPRGVTVSPDGQTVYVANTALGQNTVFVYAANAITGQLTQTATIATGAGTRPRNVAVSPDGSTLYIHNQGNNSLKVVDTATNTITGTVSIVAAGQTSNLAINAAGTRVYTTSAGGTISVIDTATNTVTSISAGDDLRGVAVTPDDRFVYVSGQNVDRIRTVDAASNTIIATTNLTLSDQPFGLTVSPDGSTLYVALHNAASIRAFSIDSTTGVLTSLGNVAGGTMPQFPGMCGKSAMLSAGSTFVASTPGALSCAGSTATVNGATVLVTTNNLTMNTPVILGTPGATLDTNGNNAALGGAITGTGSLTKSGLGTLTLTGNGTYSGATAVDAGTLRAGAANAFSANSAYTVASVAPLALNNLNQTIGSLAGAGPVSLGTATLTTGNDNTSTTYSGVMSDTGGLTKIGTGTLTLAGNNLYSGGTSINGGAIAVTGSLVSATVNAGGTLAGTGTVGPVTVNGGTLAPGLSTGILNTGNLSLNATSTLTIEINGPTVGSQHDQVNVTGTVSLGGAALNVPPGPALAAGNVFTIINNNLGGPALGTFAGLAEGAAFAAGVRQFRVSYVGGSGTNDVTLTALATDAPTISKGFGAGSILLTGTTTLTFTLTNPNPALALTGVAFTDTLPAGLTVANGTSPRCGGTLSISGGNLIALAGATLGANANCVFAVTVTGTTAGTKNNTTSAMTSNEAPPSGTAAANLDVVAPPTIGKAFGAASLGLGGTTTLTFTLTNPAANAVALTGVAFTDPLPAGLVVATPNGLTGACGGGTITATAGSNSIGLSGGTIAAGGTCTFAVNVTATATGNQVNTSGNVTSTNGGSGNSATASLSVLAPALAITKTHAGTFNKDQTGSYSLTVSNAGAGPTAGPVTVVDTLPAGLTATALSGSGWACTLATLTCTRSDALAAGASYPPITLTVNVAPTASGSVTNSAAVSGGGGGTATATDPTIIRPPAPIPTLGTWAFILLALVLATTAVRAMRARFG